MALAPLLEAIRQIGTLTREHGDTRVLFDLLELEGEMPFVGQVQVGEQVAQSLAHVAKVASAVLPDKVTRTSEKVARSRGAQLRIFDNRAAALAWLRDEMPPTAQNPGADPEPMDPVRAAVWQALRHLFPPDAQAIQLPSGTLAIAWAIASRTGGADGLAKPLTIRLEPELLEQMRLATPEQRQRMAEHQEPAFRAGLMGYDPYSDVPSARVIVLG
jgi:hypothetical protein